MLSLLFLSVNRKLSMKYSFFFILETLSYKSTGGNDYDKALGLLSDVLQEEKDRGWPEGVPSTLKYI